jgi:putative endonuclease
MNLHIYIFPHLHIKFLAKHNDTGTLGEKLAVGYLLSKGYTILHQNWRHSRWEVDIIASKNNFLHFIEIKTRRTKQFGLPEEKVSKQKLQHLINAAEFYLYENPQWKHIRFDILAILLLKDKPVEFFLIEDVFV